MQRVRELFRAPERVAQADFLRREVAARMHERLMLIKATPERVLDAGCGTGADLVHLQQRYPSAQVIGLDGVPAMLAAAARREEQAASAVQRLLHRLAPAALRPGVPGAALVCSDFARLPLAAGSVDMLWSNLALHWHPHPDMVFSEWRRVLRVEGLLMFSGFGPSTFKEVRAAFSVLDDAPHTLSFVDMHDLGDMLIHGGFSTPVMDMETITITYDSTARLLAELRAWGGNPLSTRRRGLIGRRAWQRVLDAFEVQRGADGKLHLTCEVVYGHAFRPAPRVTAAGESIVRFDPPRPRR